MKGNTIPILILAGSVFLFRPACGLGVQGPWGLAILPTDAALTIPVSPAPATGDMLQFIDGSVLHGELKKMDASSGLLWENPAAKNPIDFRPGHIDAIRFAHAGFVTVAPTSHLRLVNGDDLFGVATSLDDNHLTFSTWFGGTMNIPRASLQSITFLPTNFSILYEGPGDAEGWIIANHNPESWVFRDGAFISEGGGTLGRDFKLSGSSTIEFDLAWSDSFGLLASIYSDAVNLDSANSYVIEFTREQVNLRRVDSGRQFQFKTFGGAPLSLAPGQNKIHVAIQSNKAENTVAVFVDNVLIKRWKDENGFNATGGGLLFQQDGVNGATVKLSNFKISQWEGRYEPEPAGPPTNIDTIHFINHDQAAGKITGLSGGKVTLALGETLLQIPLQRVTQINFPAAPAQAATRGPWEVRAYFPRGGSVSFQLEKWSEKEVSGRSAIFGSLAFQPGQIRQLEFNLDRIRAAAPVVSDREFEGLDE